MEKITPFIWLIILSEIISFLFFLKLLSSRESIHMKIVFSMLLVVPVFGPIMYLFLNDPPPPQPRWMQNKGDAYSNTPMRGEYTDRWLIKKDVIQQQIKRLDEEDKYKHELWMKDATESEVGVHLIFQGDRHVHLSAKLDMEFIANELNKLNWKEHFYQFIVVVEPGISMEVGGSLNGIDGLSAMYRNRHERIDAVIRNPPKSVLEMQEILEAFIKPEEKWERKYAFDYYSY